MYNYNLGSFFKTVKSHALSKESVSMLNINSKESLLQLKTVNKITKGEQEDSEYLINSIRQRVTKELNKGASDDLNET